MKRTLLSMLICSLLFSACSVFSPAEPTPEPTQAPTPTPDPCSAELIVEDMEKIQKLINKFQEIALLANFTPQPSLIDPVMKLQEFLWEMGEYDAPECQRELKAASIQYMNSVIQYLALFMGGESAENVDTGIQNSQFLWHSVLREFNTVMAEAGLEPQEIPDISSQMPKAQDTGVLVTNDGTQSVNVRLHPDLNADIIGSLDPSVQALGIGKNAVGDWIQINLGGLLGWVFAEMVALDPPIDTLPVVEEAQ
jgi:hypothetical protein